MTELSEGNKNVTHTQKTRRFGDEIRSMHEAGVPDSVISSELDINISRIKRRRREMGISGITSRQSLEAKTAYVRENPNIPHEIVPPPIEGLESE